MTDLRPEPVVDDLGRRELIVGAAALLAAAACSGSGGGGAATTTTRGADATRAISTPLGDFTIPVDPRRVVAIEPRLDVEMAVAYGLPLVAIGGNSAEMSGQPVAPWVPLPDPDVPLLGGVTDDLEDILRIEPDLIVCNTGSVGLEELAGIAPLLAYDWDQPWRDIMGDVSVLLGREDDPAQVVTDVDEALTEVRERHARALADARVAIIQPELDGTYHGAGTVDSPFIHLQVLAELGGSVVPFLADRQWNELVSFEELDRIADADAVMVVSFDVDAARATLDGVGPWTDLPAVAAGRVHFADARLNFGLVYSARENLDQIDTLYGLVDGA